VNTIGRGYPKGLKDKEIPEGSRIICIADSYDAMTSRRPYRNALSSDYAIKQIEKNLGTQFDPEMGRHFIDLYNSGSI